HHLPGGRDRTEPYGAATRHQRRNHGAGCEGVLPLRPYGYLGERDGDGGERGRVRNVHGGQSTVLPLQPDHPDRAGLWREDVAVERPEYGEHVRVPGAG